MFSNKAWQNNTNFLTDFLKKRHFIIVASFIVVLFILEGFFLYHYFYKALTQTKALAELKQQSAITELKLSTFEKITKFYAEKQQKTTIDWNKLRDPFITTTTPTNPSP